MSNERLREELSAYLDGEAANPDQIARLLHDDPDAARCYNELAKLSEYVRALPEPDINPAFMTRVMAQVRETEMEHPVWTWSKSTAWAMVASCVVVFVAVTAYTQMGDQEPRRDPVAAQVLNMVHSGDAVRMANMLGGDVTDVADTAAATPASDSDQDQRTPSRDNNNAYASVRWIDDSESFSLNGGDLDVQLGSLSDSEVSAFRGLLEDYVEGDHVI